MTSRSLVEYFEINKTLAGARSLLFEDGKTFAVAVYLNLVNTGAADWANRLGGSVSSHQYRERLPDDYAEDTYLLAIGRVSFPFAANLRRPKCALNTRPIPMNAQLAVMMPATCSPASTLKPAKPNSCSPSSKPTGCICFGRTCSTPNDEKTGPSIRRFHPPLSQNRPT
jgi:hypothetical protein